MVHHAPLGADELDWDVRVLRALFGHPKSRQGQPRLHEPPEGLHLAGQFEQRAEPVHRQQHAPRSHARQGHQPHWQAAQGHQRGDRKRGQARDLPPREKPQHPRHGGRCGAHGRFLGDGHRDGERVLGHGSGRDGSGQRHLVGHQASDGDHDCGIDCRDFGLHGVQPLGEQSEQGGAPHGGEQPRIH